VLKESCEKLGIRFWLIAAFLERFLSSGKAQAH
jgi:hypothetical protein